MADYDIVPESDDVAEARRQLDPLRSGSSSFATTAYELLTAEDAAKLPAMKWLVKGVLPRTGLVVLYGPSGSGKSFVAFDLASAVAGDAAQWCGRRVAVHVPVTIVCLEGSAGIGQRTQAWKQYHRRAQSPRMRVVMRQPFNFLEPAQVEALGRAIVEAGCAGGLTIVDTLNRATEGADENSALDMGRVIASADRLQQLVGGLLMVVHHAGKDSTKGMRGHSSLRSAADAALEVTNASGQRTLRIDKAKDAIDDLKIPFRLETVVLGQDEDGDPITSCVVVPDELPSAATGPGYPKGPQQVAAINALGPVLCESKHFNKTGAPAGRPCIPVEQAIETVAGALTVEPRRKKNRARRLVEALVASRVLGICDDWLWRN
ncbi:AAA family ATPase [Oxalobacteraceae bacterium OM1]|nr:AAA family ATPase [Oxalobacteraceae bacterium OM1]